jgi:hypothetical protein
MNTRKGTSCRRHIPRNTVNLTAPGGHPTGDQIRQSTSGENLQDLSYVEPSAGDTFQDIPLREPTSEDIHQLTTNREKYSEDHDKGQPSRHYSQGNNSMGINWLLISRTTNLRTIIGAPHVELNFGNVY